MAEGYPEANSAASALLQLVETLRESLTKNTKYVCGTCPDPACRRVLYFPAYEHIIECSNCGQRHDRSSLLNVKDMKSMGEGEKQRLLSTVPFDQSAESPRRAEMVKVKGISHYQCKLLSHLLTTHGMDKNGQPRLLKDLGTSDRFDCSKLSRYGFAIEESYLNQPGYGRDAAGTRYLGSTLSLLVDAGGGEEVLVPLHADGDGHCLVHAVSRCLVGRELFWHSLRSQLQSHLQECLSQYQAIFKDFIEEEEWSEIIEEAGPDYRPQDGQGLGLRNIHIFGLANVLHRPIILLDNLEGMQSSADYSGVFLPALVPPSSCQYEDPNGDKHFNQPIVVGWSSPGRNHFIPLVQVKGRKAACIPLDLCPKVWGVAPDLLCKYVTLNEGRYIAVGGGKAMSDAYLSRLIEAMEQAFYQQYDVKPSLVADVEHHIYRKAGYVSLHPMDIAAATKDGLQQNRIRRCLYCKALSSVTPEWFQRDGLLYSLAADKYSLVPGNEYYFPMYRIKARYDAENNQLVPTSVACMACGAENSTREIRSDGSILLRNGDRTDTPTSNSKCGCGFKHYWEGKEYDNLPKTFKLPLSWNGQTVETDIYWFENESDPALNSNAYEIARAVVEKQFPGDFGSERLVQSAVNIIIKSTTKKSTTPAVASCFPDGTEDRSTPDAKGGYSDEEESKDASHRQLHKWISMGPKSKVLHKEELGVSVTEQKIKQRVEEKAASSLTGKAQMHRTVEMLKRQCATVPSSQPSNPEVGMKKSRPAQLPGEIRIRVTTSDGQAGTLTLSCHTTFVDLQEMIEKELNIPPSQQVLRFGIPPRVFQPSDPGAPVNLQNGDKVTVEVVPSIEEPEPNHLSSGSSSAEASGSDLSVGSKAQGSTAGQESDMSKLEELLDSIDLWPAAVVNPAMFAKQGIYYEEVKSQFGERFVNGIHFLLKGFPKKKFTYNAKSDAIELCLGQLHIPVRSLSPEEEELAKFVAQGSPTNAPDPASFSLGQVKKDSTVAKAFTGKGHSLLPSEGIVKDNSQDQ